MAYYPDVLTNRKLNKLEQNIVDMYGRASQEMLETWNKYVQGYDEHINGKVIHHDGIAERVKKEYDKYVAGETNYQTIDEFNSWVQTQVQRGEGYRIMADKLADRATNADLVAQALINDTTPSIYSLNANYEAYRISQLYDNIDFQIIDEQTARRLIGNDNHIEFRTVRVNPVRDYDWNREQIHKALTAGILQGKSIDKLTDDFLKVMHRDENSARRNARTAVTSAQNAGRLETYYRAEQMGIEIYKEWISSHDSRVRETHGALDGERVPYDSLFSNGLRYPADVEGAPEEVYNCRCTMRAILPNVNDEKRKTYKDWLAEQEDKQIAQSGKLIGAV